MSKRVLGLFKGLNDNVDLVEASGFSKSMIDHLQIHLFNQGFVNQDHSLSSKGLNFLESLEYQEDLVQEFRKQRLHHVKTAVLLVDQSFSQSLVSDVLDRVLQSNVLIFQKLGFERIFILTNDLSIAPSAVYRLITFVDQQPLVVHFVQWLDTVDLTSFIVVNGTRLFESRLIDILNQTNAPYVLARNRENSRILEAFKGDKYFFKDYTQAQTLRDLFQLNDNESLQLIDVSPKSIRSVDQKTQKQRFKRLLERESKYHQIKASQLVSKLVSSDKADRIDRLGGLTNRNYYFKIDNQQVVARIPGDFTQEFINRRYEDENSTLMSLLGINTAHIYFNRDDGAKIAGYVEHALTLNAKLLEKKIYLEKVAHLLKTLHTSHLLFVNDFHWEEELQSYEAIVNYHKVAFPSDYEDIKERVKHQFNQLRNTQKVACHNDALCENFVLNEKSGRLYLIDWEYSGNNYAAWDLASIIVESQLEKHQQEILLNTYQDIDPIDVEICILLQDFLWSVWGLMKHAQKMDFYDYYQKRYDRAKKQLEKLESYENFAH